MDERVTAVHWALLSLEPVLIVDTWRLIPRGTCSMLFIGIFIWCLDDPAVGEVTARRNHAESSIPL